MTSVVKTFRGVTYEVTLDATVSALTVHVAERLTGEVGDPPHPHLRQSFVFLFPPLPPFSPPQSCVRMFAHGIATCAVVECAENARRKTPCPYVLRSRRTKFGFIR